MKASGAACEENMQVTHLLGKIRVIQGRGSARFYLFGTSGKHPRFGNSAFFWPASALIGTPISVDM
jgi:hypothetical protein